MSVLCITVNLYHVHQITTALLKQLMMLLDLLESIETLLFAINSTHSEFKSSIFMFFQNDIHETKSVEKKCASL